METNYRETTKAWKASRDEVERVLLHPRGLGYADLLKLPHPKRMELLWGENATESPVFKTIHGALAVRDTTPDTLAPLLDKMFNAAQSGWSSDARHGFTHSALVPIKHHACAGTIFQVRDSLFDRLGYTDIDAQLPCETLKPPFPFIYLHLEKYREDFAVFNDETGDHPWEGVYVQEYQNSLMATVDSQGKDVTLPGRTIELLFVGRTKDGDPGNDANWAIPLRLPEGSTLGAALEELDTARLHRFKELFFKLDVVKRLVFQTARILLYLSCSSVRLEMRPERQTLARKLAGVKSNAKLGKLKRQLAKTYDYVLVGPESFAEPLAGNGTHTSVTPHLRRGHFRNQRYGERLSQSKLLWIDATFINGGEAPRKDYIVS